MPNIIPSHQLTRMQENLPTLRKLTGCSIEEFATLLGLTRQTISNLETGKTPFTPIYYRGIFQFIDEAHMELVELSIDNENASHHVLWLAMHLLINAEDIEETDYAKCKEVFGQLASLMSENLVSSPLSTLRGLLFSSYGLREGDVIPSDSLIAAVNAVVAKFGNGEKETMPTDNLRQ